jgi:hypothetical protein
MMFLDQHGVGEEGLHEHFSRNIHAFFRGARIAFAMSPPPLFVVEALRIAGYAKFCFPPSQGQFVDPRAFDSEGSPWVEKG